MAVYWPTPGFNGRTSQLCVLNRWDFNLCVNSFPLRDEYNTPLLKKLHWLPDTFALCFSCCCCRFELISCHYICHPVSVYTPTRAFRSRSHEKKNIFFADLFLFWIIRSKWKKTIKMKHIFFAPRILYMWITQAFSALIEMFYQYC